MRRCTTPTPCTRAPPSRRERARGRALVSVCRLIWSGLVSASSSGLAMFALAVVWSESASDLVGSEPAVWSDPAVCGLA